MLPDTNSQASQAPAIVVEVSAGELLDKIGILEIKRSRIADPSARANVEREWRVLTEARDRNLCPPEELRDTLEQVAQELRTVNERLWDIEDAIRVCERDGDFGGTFVELARAVYHENDRRAALKRQINQLVGSRLLEEKSYAASR